LETLNRALFTRKGTYGNAAIVREGQEQAVISPLSMQRRLAEQLQLSLATQQEAQRLLAEAKAEVEGLIEEQ